MAVDLSAVSIRRGALKGRITRFIKYLQEFPESGDLSYIRVRKSKVEEIWDEFQNLQSTIEVNAKDDTALITEQNYRYEFEELYFQAIAESEKKLEKSRSDFGNNNEQDPNQKSIECTSSNQPSIVKLAAINVPEFSGNYKEWSTFNDMFTALVHSNDALTEVQKFFYLKSSLSGEAADVVRSFETNSNNYKRAWDALNERFNNKRFMVQAHTTAIFDLEEIAEESSKKLRKFVDKLCGHIQALEAIGQSPLEWGPMLMHVITIKLDNGTLREWETLTPRTEVPQVKDLLNFLKNRFQILEAVESSKRVQTVNGGRRKNMYEDKKGTDTRGDKRRTLLHTTTVKFKCYVCEEPHPIYRCSRFLAFTVKDRQQQVNNLKLCTICLSKYHAKDRCKAKGCRKCGDQHNTLLHEERAELNANAGQSITVSAHSAKVPGTQVLLSTAIIKIYGNVKEPVLARALLDSASQGNFITNELVHRLQLDKRKIDCSISGVNSVECRASHAVSTRIQSRYELYERSIEFITLPKITTKLPIKPVNLIDSYTMPAYINLADPTYSKPGEIDVLLGAEVFFDSLRTGQYKLAEAGPMCQETSFGWVIAGSVNNIQRNIGTFVTRTRPNDCCQLEENISKFWRMEEIEKRECHSLEEKGCVEHFTKTVIRSQEGKFVVQLPFKDDVIELGNSKSIALKRFTATENRLRNNRNLQKAYVEFIDEYIQLGHMEEIPNEEINKTPAYYIPHHAVLRDNSITTKLRVVFDASCATDTGKSLNDILLKGPSIQDDLICIIARFRTHKFVMSADIEKMYRQIWVHEKDRDFQRILWRDSPEKAIKEFRLKTVTYGTSPASYLATACLKELANEQRSICPVASEAIINDFYMDDYLGGAQTIEKAIKLRDEIIQITKAAGFHLRKWIANDKRLMTGINNSDNDPLRVLNLDGSTIKTLGLFWKPVDDTYQYVVDKTDYNRAVTKRNVLSMIATIFDPLSLIGPVIIKAKLIMQQLWILNIGWDEKLPSQLYDEWKIYCQELSELKELSIPRCIIGVDTAQDVQIHCFADASQKAYAATLYLRATDHHGNHVSRLIAAKSRVSPLKVISLARLELCAAVLLVRLANKIIPGLNVNVGRRYFWSDSTIVLAWISSPSSRWKTFVSHRVGEIQEFSAISEWSHVKSKENPADILSRGCSPMELRENKLWWEGPHWLKTSENEWPNSKEEVFISREEVPETKNIQTIVLNTEIQCDLINRYSSITKLLRIIAYCLRWKKYNRTDKQFQGEIEPDEINSAKMTIIKQVQLQYFYNEMNCLRNNRNVGKSSKLKLLNPFIDEHGTLRVGGRLNNAETIDVDKRNPILLPAQSNLTKLIFRFEHYRLMHAGPQALLASVREQYWPLDGRNIARSTVNKCIICFKNKPFTFKPIMGNLPKARIQPSRAFAITGVDFAGPIKIKGSTVRNSKILKSYVCVFICFATKAVHVELVNDLSTDAFLAALRRFWSRRGYCQTLWSDNGTNFVGADRKLKELRDLFLSKEHQIKVKDYTSQIGVKWKFIPAYSPHYGGLWESAVKSVKHHLVRQLGDALLTFEELYTVLSQVEACLNSRPLTPLSSDPSDLNVLTPGHFLVGSSLTCLPEKDVLSSSINHLRRWQRVTQLTQHIWQRWSKEYLSQLQGRSKWRKSEGPTIEKNTMVIIKEPNMPPTHWKLGRIIEIQQGADGVGRIAIVLTNKGKCKHIVRNLCPLPIEN